MDFLNAMMNIVIGILSGIISGVIVSKVFLADSDLKEQRNRVGERVGMLSYIAGSLDTIIVLYKDRMQYDEAGVIKILNAIHYVVDKARDVEKSFGKMVFDDLEPGLHSIAVRMHEFSFDAYKLNDLAVETQNIYSSNMANLDDLPDETIIVEYSEKINNLFIEFENYKNDYKKTVLRLLIKDKMLIMIMVFLFCFICLTVIA